MNTQQQDAKRLREENRFKKGLAIIGGGSFLLYLGVAAVIWFVPRESAPESMAYILILIIFLPLFALIFWIQGCTLMEMHEWDQERRKK